MDNEYLGFGAVILGLVLLAVSAAAISLPGTIEPSLPGTGGDDVKHCDLSTTISVGGTTVGANIQEPSFRKSVEPSSPLSALNTLGMSQMSFLGASDIEIKFTLNGPIDRSISTTKQIGNLGPTQEDTVEFSASNLPPGTYALHHNLYWAGGNDYYKAEFEIPEGCQ